VSWALAAADCSVRYKKFRLKWEKDVMRHIPSAGKKKKGVAKPQ
jgi:hypothetical protein